MKHLKYLPLIFTIISFAQVGINSTSPTETLQVDGITRLSELPLTGTANSTFTTPSGTASGTRNQTFTGTRTVVVNENGVLGSVQGLPVTVLPNINSIQYVTKTVPINSSTPVNSVITIGNISVRFDGTNPSGGEQSLSFKLINGITDNVVANQLKIGYGGEFGGQDTYRSAAANTWKIITNQKPNVANSDFVQYNIALLNTKEIYRLTVSVNPNINTSAPNVSSPAQVTLFLERLTNQ